MADSQLSEGEAKGAELRGVRTGSQERPSEPTLLPRVTLPPTRTRKNTNVWKPVVRRSGTDEKDRKSGLLKESHLFQTPKKIIRKDGPWMDNEISFPSVIGCQLVDSSIILDALIKGFQVWRIYAHGGSSLEVMYEHCFRNLGTEIKAKLRESRVPLVGFSEEVNNMIGVIDLNITMRELDRLRTVTMEFAVVKCHSPYNVILGRTGMRSLGAVASTIHSMIKFPTVNEIATMMKAPEPKDSSIKKKKEAQEEQRPEAGHPDVTTPRPSPLERKATLNEKKEDNNELVETPRENKAPEKVAVYDKYPDQPITIGGTYP
ncbi:hypothetical protein Tco_1384312 [Tanacetum coccineum]